MCDRAVPQQNLCAELAALLTTLPDSAPDFPAAASWLAAFWQTLAEKWTSIDALRLEKFLLLVRRVLAASFEWARSSSDSATAGPQRRTKKKKQGKENSAEQAAAGRRAALLAVLRSLPFEPTGDLSKMPVGLRLHVLDIWVDEAERVGLLPSDGEDEVEEEDDDNEDRAFLDQLRPLVEAQLKSPCKPVRVRAKESLADERLPWNRGRGAKDDGSDESDGEDDGWAGFKD